MKQRGFISVVKNDECAKVFDKASRRIIKSQICAGGGTDSCRIDSGGALMGFEPSSSRHVVVGVLSFTPSPWGSPGWPGIYTRVDAYIDWILSKLEP